MSYYFDKSQFDVTIEDGGSSMTDLDLEANCQGLKGLGCHVWYDSPEEQIIQEWPPITTVPRICEWCGRHELITKLYIPKDQRYKVLFAKYWANMFKEDE